MLDEGHVHNMIERDEGCGKKSVKIGIWEKPVSWQRKAGNSSLPERRKQTAGGRRAHAEGLRRRCFAALTVERVWTVKQRGFWEPAPAQCPASTSKSDFFSSLVNCLFLPLLMCPSPSSLSWNTITWTPQWLQFRLPSLLITTPAPPNSCKNLAMLILLFFTLPLLYLNKKIIQLLHSWLSSIAHESSKFFVLLLFCCQTAHSIFRSKN